MAACFGSTIPQGRRLVYVIASAAGPVKIGITSNPTRRFAQVLCGSSTNLWFAFLGLTTTHGASQVEAACHSHFADRRTRGEWFDVAPERAAAEVIRTAARLGFRMIDCAPPAGADAILSIDVSLPTGTSIITREVLADFSSADVYARAEKSPATLRAYQADLRHFAAWCERVNEAFVPARPEAVAAYIASLADQGKATSTVHRRLAAIAYVHRQKGENDPTATERVRRVTRGIRRTIGTAPTQKAPATARYVKAMVKALPDSLLGRRDRALLLIGFAAALRRSELVALDVADIERQPEGILVHVRRSKTDQEGAVSPGRLTDQSVALVIKHRAAAAKLDPTLFSGHSLRAGFVTSALEDGADTLRVMDQTRHRSVDTLKKYDRRAKAFAAHAGKGFL